MGFVNWYMQNICKNPTLEDAYHAGREQEFNDSAGLRETLKRIASIESDDISWTIDDLVAMAKQALTNR